MIFSIPNIITYFRIIVVPIFLFLYFSDNDILISISIVLYFFGAISDYFDGLVARKFNSSSKFGQFIDPLADKIIVVAALIAFIILDIVPMWMVIVIVLRDIITTYMRILADKKHLDMKTSNLAKWKTFSQFLFIGYVQTLQFVAHSRIFEISYDSAYEFIYSDLTYFGMLLLTIYTAVTLIDYIIKNKSIFQN